MYLKKLESMYWKIEVGRCVAADAVVRLIDLAYDVTYIWLSFSRTWSNVINFRGIAMKGLTVLRLKMSSE